MKTFVLASLLLSSTIGVFAFPSYEPFADATTAATNGTSYSAGFPLAGQTNALGEGWYAMATAQTGATVNLASGSLTATNGLPTPKGNMVQLINQVGPGARYNIPPTTNGTLFYSALIQLQNISSLAVAKSDSHGGGAFNMGYNNTQTIGQGGEPSGYSATLYYGATNGGYILGIGRGTSGTARFWETNSASPHLTSDTLFVVAEYEFVSGVSNDIVRLWVNPDPATLGAASYPQPTVVIDGVTNISTDADVNGGSLQSFCIANRNTTTPDLMYVDELRLGTTWAHVTAAYVAPPVIPTLVISQQDPSTVLLAWGTNSVGFVLQSANQLLSSNIPWANVTGSPNVSGSNYIQTDTISPGGISFYRLKH